MSYLQVHFWPGGTEEQYQAMIKVLHPEGPARRSAFPYQRPSGGRLSDLGPLGFTRAERSLHAEHTPSSVSGERRICGGAGGAHRPGRLRQVSLTGPRCSALRVAGHLPVERARLSSARWPAGAAAQNSRVCSESGLTPRRCSSSFGPTRSERTSATCCGDR